MISLRSSLRRKLLTFFYLNRAARAYVRQLSKALEADSTNVSRELARLRREGFLKAETEGRQLYYSVDRDYRYLKPVFALLQGSIGIQPTLRRTLEAVAGVESAWLYGSFAKDEADSASDIDLLIVGAPEERRLAAEVRMAEKLLRRDINYTVLTSSDLRRRLRAREPFLTDIWDGKRVEVIGHGHHQTAAGQPGAGEAVSRRRTQESGRGAENASRRRRNRLPNRVSSHDQGLAGADAEPRAASAGATGPSRRDH